MPRGNFYIESPRGWSSEVIKNSVFNFHNYLEIQTRGIKSINTGKVLSLYMSLQVSQVYFNGMPLLHSYKDDVTRNAHSLHNSSSFFNTDNTI